MMIGFTALMTVFFYFIPFLGILFLLNLLTGIRSVCRGAGKRLLFSGKKVGDRFVLCGNYGRCRRVYVACRFGGGGGCGGGIDRCERVPVFRAARFDCTYALRPMN